MKINVYMNENNFFSIFFVMRHMSVLFYFNNAYIMIKSLYNVIDIETISHVKFGTIV